MTSIVAIWQPYELWDKGLWEVTTLRRGLHPFSPHSYRQRRQIRFERQAPRGKYSRSLRVTAVDTTGSRLLGGLRSVILAEAAWHVEAQNLACGLDQLSKPSLIGIANNHWQSDGASRSGCHRITNFLLPSTTWRARLATFHLLQNGGDWGCITGSKNGPSWLRQPPPDRADLDTDLSSTNCRIQAGPGWD